MIFNHLESNLIDPFQTIAYWNSKEHLLSSLSIPVEDRAFYFADAVYEVIRIYRGKTWLQDIHMKRLSRSLRELELAIDEANINELISKNIGVNNIQEGYVYVQVSRGTSPRNHLYPNPKISTNALIYSKEFKDDPWKDYRRDGINIILEPDIRWLRRDIKTVNLLPNCMAKQKAERNGAQEAIFFEADGKITEGSSNNVFIVENKMVITHPANNHILNGITRLFVIHIAKQMGIEVQERCFSEVELKQASEIFITGTTSEILLVSSIHGVKRSNFDSKIYKQLRYEFTKSISGGHQDFSEEFL